MSDETPKEKLRWPCELNGNLVVACYALSEVAQATKVKGVRRANLVDRESFKPTRTLFAVHSGDHTKRGIAMNFCPFCGAKLRVDEPAREAVEATP